MPGFVWATAADDRELWPALKRFFARDEVTEARRMSTSVYTTAELEEIDERCLQIAGELGFDVPPIVYHLLRSSEIYDIAAPRAARALLELAVRRDLQPAARRLPHGALAHLRADRQYRAGPRLPAGRQQPGRPDARHGALHRPRVVLRRQRHVRADRPRDPPARPRRGGAHRRLHGRARPRSRRGLPRRLRRDRHPPAAGADAPPPRAAGRGVPRRAPTTGCSPRRRVRSRSGWRPSAQTGAGGCRPSRRATCWASSSTTPVTSRTGSAT